jgi:lysophospholipase L1-like esterase
MQITAIPADQPAPQDGPLFAAAHAALVKKARTGRIDVYFVGDSITRRWQATDCTHQENWNRNFRGWNAANFGWGGDTTQNILYRLHDGELEGVNPRVFVVMAGTNNVGDTPRDHDEALVQDVARGVKAILRVLLDGASGARVILTGITPRNNTPGQPTALIPTIVRINDRIASLADGDRIRYITINDRIAAADGTLLAGMSEDGLHLTDRAYQFWADALTPILREWLGPPAAVDLAPPATGTPVLP